MRHCMFVGTCGSRPTSSQACVTLRYLGAGSHAAFGVRNEPDGEHSEGGYNMLTYINE
jgi:hypothetical protein